MSRPVNEPLPRRLPAEGREGLFALMVADGVFFVDH
jgi:hypothetical protein